MALVAPGWAGPPQGIGSNGSCGSGGRQNSCEKYARLVCQLGKRLAIPRLVPRIAMMDSKAKNEPHVLECFELWGLGPRSIGVIGMIVEALMN